VLSPKPWKLEAVVRLLMRLFICMCFGWLVLALIYAKPRAAHEQIKLIGLAATAAMFLAGAIFLLRKEWTAQNFFSSGLAALMVFYVGLVLAMWVQHLAGAPPDKTSSKQMVVSMLSLQGATLILTALFLKEQATSWRDAFGLSNNVGRALLVGFAAAAIFLPCASLLKVLSEKGIQLFTHQQAPTQQAVEAIQAAPTLSYKILLGVFTLLLVPWGEEVLFRGILYTTIKQAGFPRIAFGLSSVLFAAIHTNAAIFVPLLLLAMLLAWLYDKTDNLLAPIAAHAAFNTAGFISILLQSNGSA
jgi:membrane protease YdiL (CAAX protease family)